jgi:uncharacterized membrane protein YeaQ/YmgE (transglycosylase-associated protein family)
MQHAYEPQFLGQAWHLLQLVVVAALAGWTAERVLDTDVHTRGLPLLSGLFGLYVGPRLLEMAGWPAVGPEVAGQPVLAAFVGALLIAAFLKLASLGAAGPRS